MSDNIIDKIGHKLNSYIRLTHSGYGEAGHALIAAIMFWPIYIIAKYVPFEFMAAITVTLWWISRESANYEDDKDTKGENFGALDPFNPAKLGGHNSREIMYPAIVSFVFAIIAWIWRVY